MKKASLGSLLAAGLLAGCTSGNSGIEPPVKSVVSPLTGTLQFAVGTATYDLGGGTVVNGLNVVTSYRTAAGLSATLVSTPTISGPAGFTLPATAPSADLASNTISGQSQFAPADAFATPTTTFRQSGGVFSYGILPVNSSNQATNGSPTGSNYGEPFYVKGSLKTTLIGGAPAYINTQDGTYPGGFSGFGLGYNSFAGTTLVAGTYSLSLAIPTSPTTIGKVPASATLASVAPLGQYMPPTFAPSAALTAAAGGNGGGGGTFTVTIPAGVLETTLVITSDQAGGCGSSPYYTLVDHTPGPGVATLTLPDNVGSIKAGKTNPSLCSGDTINAYAIGTDYRLYEASVGQSPTYASYDATGASAAPAFFFPGGPQQADITVSTTSNTAAAALP